MGAFLYEKDNPDPNALVGVLISFLCAFACAAIGGLIYSILTITLRVNQNVTGLALTIFGTGFGNFFGGSISKLAGGVGQISVKVTGSAYTAKSRDCLRFRLSEVFYLIMVSLHISVLL